MLMLKSLFTLFFLLTLNIIGNSQDFEWAKAIGGTEFDEGYSITVDGKRNVFATGFFQGTADFDPGGSTFNIASKGSKDIFISKLDKNGNFVWVKTIGGALEDIGYSIITDNFGNVYVSGSFEGTVDFDPGSGIYNLNSSGSKDIFILKLDKNGNFVWAKSIGGMWTDVATSITINDGNLFVTGYFAGTVDFDPGPGVYNLNTGGTFILKLDSDGDFIWAKSFIGSVKAHSISIDRNGNILTTGYLCGTADFDPGVNAYNLNDATGGTWCGDIFISKLDSDGNFVWAKRIGGGTNDDGYSITTDDNGNVYTTGYFEGSVDFDPGVNVYNLNSIVSSWFKNDLFILKLDSDGNFVWAKRIGGNNTDIGKSIEIDRYGNIYTTGIFMETVDFDPGTGIYNLFGSPSLTYSIFVLKLDTYGDFVWALEIYNQLTGISNAESIYLDRAGNIYLTGFFSDIVDFDPGTDTFNLSSKSTYADIFILKLSQCPTSFDTIQVSTCDSYTWIDGKTYTQSTDTAEYILTNAQGCDSIVSLDLTIYKKDSTSMQTTACNEYIWKTDTLKNTGIYRYDTLNIFGCDSTVTLDLTINKSSDSNFKLTSCDSYIWHDSSYTQSGVYRFDTINAVGCDSTVTLDLTLNSSSSTTLKKSACESYTWHDSIYTASGTYRFDTLNITGCDSIVTLNLTIVDKIENLDTMYICQGDTIEIFDSEIWEDKLVSKTFLSQKGCDSIQNIQVLVNLLPEGTITESICEGDSIFVVNRWLSEEGTYTIHKENAGECDSLYSVDITLRPLKYTYDTINICQGDTIEVFGFDISTETDVEQSYVGSNDCDSTAYAHITVLPLSSSQSQITLCPGDSILIAGDWIKSKGEYKEHLTGINGCDSIANIHVKVLAKPEEPGIKIDCDIPEILLSTTAATPWHIQWDNGDTTSQSTYQNQSQAILTLQTDMGCKEVYTIALPALPDLVQIPNLQDTTIDLNQTLSIGINTDTSNWQINWSPEELIDCPNCQNISISPEETTVIKLSMTHSSGCKYSREFTLYVQEPELEIPNIFTPNGDGINDNWTFRVPKEIKLISCTIFDRWGEKIYQNRGNTPINWDGKYKAGSVLSGVYVYIIEFVDSKGENKAIAGDVTVVR